MVIASGLKEEPEDHPDQTVKFVVATRASSPSCYRKGLG
jgi:hypothetical protein